MKYVNLGNSGLKVSKIGFGKIIDPQPQNFEVNKKLIQTCLEAGINHFDTSQIYNNGQCQVALGNVINALNVSRQNVIISTKIQSGKDPCINSTRTLSRKHVKEGLIASLKRLQLDYVDVLYAHIFYEHTTIQQLCRAFNQLIEEGLTFYWTISNWDANFLFDALAICEKYNLHKPICIQLQYNMLQRKQVQSEYDQLFKRYKLGLIAWGSVTGGFLSGKHMNGVSEEDGNKFKDQFYKNLYFVPFNNETTIKAVTEIKQLVEKQLKCSLVVAALAWCLKYPYLSAALIGARKVQQLVESLKAVQIVENLTPQIESKINKILDNSPQARMNFLNWTLYEHNRPISK